jgi:hypothetical protein
MGQQPVRGQRPRQPASQPRLVGQHPQQRRPKRASSRLNPARGAPIDHMGGFGNAQRNAVTAAAIAITLTRRIAEPGGESNHSGAARWPQRGLAVPTISAGRRAVIQRVSRRWRPGHSPMHHRLDCMSMQRRPQDERPVMR